MRLADCQNDYAAIWKALQGFRALVIEQPEAYEWTTEIDFEEALGNILLAIDRGEGYVVDGYLVMVVTAQPWYNATKVLREWLTLKLYPGGSVDSVAPALRAIAKERGCKVIFTGDSSPARIMAGTFLRAGHKQVTVSFYEVVNNE